MDNYNLHILGEAKNEYTRQLVNVLTPRVLEGIRSIYDSAREVCEKHGDEQYLKKFQALLAQIPKWTLDILDKEWNRIMRKSDCDWLDELLKAVFVSHTKVLMAIKSVKKPKGSIDIDVPTGAHFLHQVYLETARSFWKRPYLMYHKNPSIEVQKNLYESELIVGNAVNETIRKMMPVKNILKDYLGSDFRDEDLDDIDDEVLSSKTRNNLRKLVKEEIEQTLSNGSYKKQSGGSSVNSTGNQSITSNEDDKEVNDERINTLDEMKEDIHSELERVGDEHRDNESKDTLMEQLNTIEKDFHIQETIPEEPYLQNRDLEGNAERGEEKGEEKGEERGEERDDEGEKTESKQGGEVMNTIKRIEFEISKKQNKKTEMPIIRKDDNEAIENIVDEKLEKIAASRTVDEDNFSFFDDAAPF
jgi:hypothetical protein